MLSDLKSQLKNILELSISTLSFPPDSPIPVISLDIPSDKKFGDYSCNAALRIASFLKKSPMDVAQAIQQKITEQLTQSELQSKIEKVDIARPGFINFYLKPAAVLEILEEILQQKENFGRGCSGSNLKVQIEFVSANPTGPLSVAHARQAAVGDALGNILRFIGLDVTKEYYVNDEGNQINILGRSIEQRSREILGETIVFAEDNYQGEYIKDMAQIFMDGKGIKKIDDLIGHPTSEFTSFGVNYLLNIIKTELSDFGVNFDVWSHQSEIATNDSIEKVIELLRQKGFIYEHEGAVWFKSTDLGDDKDRVIKKSDGSYTYLTPDIVYHKNKFERGFNRVFNIWGPDHHGYIPRLKASVQALGFERDALEVLIVQLATIFRAGKPLSMSTRRGQYISLQEVMDEVGCDAARFFFLMRHIKAHLEFDLELAKKQTPENPVYYIQYAHARIHSILNLADPSVMSVRFKDFKLLQQTEELELIKKIGHFPDILLLCYSQLDPFALVGYLQECATAFHKFYDRHRVLDLENPELSAERLSLINAARMILFSGLKLLGVSAPEKM